MMLLNIRITTKCVYKTQEEDRINKINISLNSLKSGKIKLPQKRVPLFLEWANRQSL